jgi:hypothetical protein
VTTPLSPTDEGCQEICRKRDFRTLQRSIDPDLPCWARQIWRSQSGNVAHAGFSARRKENLTLALGANANVRLAACLVPVDSMNTVVLLDSLRRAVHFVGDRPSPETFSRIYRVAARNAARNGGTERRRGAATMLNGKEPKN